MNPYEQRRRRVLDQLQFGEMMVLYSGESVASSMDEGFEFEANHHFFYLTLDIRADFFAAIDDHADHPGDLLHIAFHHAAGGNGRSADADAAGDHGA